ncbi:MAG: DinB family protein, partial [Phycisphaerae bacterium]
DYPSVESVLEKMAVVQDRTIAAVRGMTDDMLAAPAFGKDGTLHPHYRDKAGAIAHCDRHEAFHAGQIASIRRLLGKAYLR